MDCNVRGDYNRDSDEEGAEECIFNKSIVTTHVFMEFLCLGLISIAKLKTLQVKYILIHY